MGVGGGGVNLPNEQQAIFRFRLQRLLAHFSPLSLISRLSPWYLLFFLSASLCKICHKCNSASFFLWGKLRKQLSKNNVKASGYYEASFMSRQHKKHLCCGRMEADLRDADKTRSHCWSIGPGGTALVYPASDFGTDPKVDYFSLIRTCWIGFPSMPSRSLTSLKGVTSFSVNEEKLPMEKRVFGIRSDGMSIWCVFILCELNSTNQSSCSLTIPFVWKPCWSSSFAETLRRARTSTWVLFS